MPWITQIRIVTIQDYIVGWGLEGFKEYFKLYHFVDAIKKIVMAGEILGPECSPYRQKGQFDRIHNEETTRSAPFFFLPRIH